MPNTSQNIRILVCRAAFVLLGVAPLVLTVAAYAHTRVVNRSGIVETWLSRTLGLGVGIVQVQATHPATTRYSAITLTDTETTRPIARCSSVTRRQSRTGALYSFQQVAIQTEQIDQIWQTIHDRLLMSPALISRPTQFHLNDIRFVGVEGSLNCDAIQGTLSRDAGVASLDLEVSLPPVENSNRAFVSVRRQTGDQPTTSVRLETGARPLPCWFLSAGANWLPTAIQDAKFSGKVFASRRSATAASRASWDAEVTGRIVQILLDDLIPSKFGRPLAGLADVQIQSGKFAHGMITDLEFTIRSERGTISAQLLRDSVRELKLGVGPLPAGEAELEFDQFGATVHIGDDGLSIVGVCRNAPAGVIMQLADGNAVIQSTVQPQPCGNLLRCLVADRAAQVPAAAELKPLLQVLPFGMPPSH